MIRNALINSTAGLLVALGVSAYSVAGQPSSPADTALSLEQLRSENAALRGQVQALEARREAFRWSRFPQGPVLRSGTVQKTVRTPDGRLALCTDGQGLVFYDGVRLELADSLNGLPDNFVTACVPLDSGSAWVGTAGGLALYDNGRISLPDNLPQPLQRASVSSLLRDSGGGLWVGTQGQGVWQGEHETWECLPVEQDSLTPGLNNINDLALDPVGGGLWAATAGGGACRLKDGAWERFPAPLGPGSEEIYCLTPDRDGLLWIGTAEAGAGFWDGIRWRRVGIPSGPQSGVTCLVELDNGDLFFGTTDGAFIYQREYNSWQRLPLPEELANYPVISAVESHGALWLSPSSQGLYIYDLALIRRYGLEQGLPDLEVYRLSQAPDGRIWCATRNGAARLEGQRWVVPPEASDLPDRLVTCIEFGAPGTIYFGTYSGLAILKDGTWKVLNRDNGLASNTINHLELDSLGALWISTEGGGLALYRGDSLVQFRTEQGLPSDQVQAVLAAGDHAVWVATRKGLARGDSSGFTSPSPGPDGSAPGVAHFTSLSRAADGSLWAGTYGQGAWQLSLSGAWTHYTADQGLGSNEVLALAPVSRGRVAFATVHGLSVYDGAQWRNYGPADGLSPGVVKDVLTARDSSLWLSIQDQGVLRFDPDRFPPPETWIRTPSGSLTALSNSNQPLDLDLSAGNLSETSQRGRQSRIYLDGGWYEQSAQSTPDTLTTDSLSLGLVALTPWWPGESGAFRFSWKLDNSPWSAWNLQGALGLSHLARGTHLLFVRAKGPRLSLDPTPAVYRFYVDIPSLWSDWRLYILGGLVLLLGLVLLFRRQVAWYASRLAHRAFRLLEPNPFHPQRPTGPDFQGRANVLSTLLELQRPPANTSVIVYGGEKMGLTSFLLRYAELAGKQGLIPVHLDLAERWFPDLRSLLGRLESCLEEKDDADDTATPEGTPESLVARVRARGGAVLILLDNAEILARLAARDPELGPRLVPALRELVLGGSGTSLVFGLHDPDILRERLAPLYEMSRLVELLPLDPEASRAVFEKPLAGRTVIQSEARERLVSLCGGQPFLLHSLGQVTVDLMNRERTNFLSRELAERAADNLVESPPTLIPDRWEALTRTEKLLLAAAVSVRAGSRGQIELRAADIAGILKSHRVPLVEEELSKAAAALAGRGLAVFEPVGGRIDLGDTLFTRWVLAHQPVEAVNSHEDYDPGEVLRRVGELSAQSFRVDELIERLLATLQPPLRFGWAAFLPLDSGGAAATYERVKLGAADGSDLPDSLPAGLLDLLAASSGSLIAGATESGGRTLDVFAPGSLIVPLLQRGETVGVFAFGPREGDERWTRRDCNLIETVVEQAAVAIDNVRLYEQETERERLRQELETARRMQLAILPERSLRLPELELCAFLSPATEVGGDYFDYRRLDDGHLAFVIGDVSGHGISAGTLVSMTKSCLYNQFRVNPEVEPVMTAMNDMVRGTLTERLLMTFCYVIFDLPERRLRYSIAGHPFPYHLRATGELNELEMSAYPLGASGKAHYPTATLEYSPGDVLVFYSDGIVEGTDPEGQQYGFERFEASIRRHAAEGVAAINESILQDYREFSRGFPQGDDITLVVIRIA